MQDTIPGFLLFAFLSERKHSPFDVRDESSVVHSTALWPPETGRHGSQLSHVSRMGDLISATHAIILYVLNLTLR